MREQGGGTLFSHVIDRQKLSVKVAAAAASEGNGEGKRRLSNGGGVYAGGYGGGNKSILGGGMLPLPPSSQAGTQQRPKGGHGSSLLLHGQRHSGTELHDFPAMERFNELRARLEPLLKSKGSAFPPSPPSPASAAPEESAVPALSLPQWGLGKRARRSRYDASKLNGASAPAKALPLRSVDEFVSAPHTHGRSSSAAGHMDSDGPSAKGLVAASRNGVISRASVTGCASARQGIAAGERTQSLPPQKGEASLTARQRSDGSGEPAIANNHVNGHTTSAAHASRATAAPEAATTSSLAQAKPRSEPQTLEWPRILLGLSRKEKEDDFFSLKGTKLPQRPKKRLKVVERALHFCTPGNALCDMSRGRYDVREKKSVKKRPRGLKAMESMESDSE